MVTLILTKRNTSSSRCNVPLDGVAFSRLDCLLLIELLKWGRTFSDFCDKGEKTVKTNLDLFLACEQTEQTLRGRLICSLLHAKKLQ